MLFKKKNLNQLNRPIPLEPAGSSDSPVGPPVGPVRPRFDPHPVQMNGPDQSDDRPAVGLAGPVRFLNRYKNRFLYFSHLLSRVGSTHLGILIQL